MRKVLCMIGIVAMWAGPALAVPVSYTENWDAYAVGTADANYVSNWSTIAGANRYPVNAGAAAGDPNSIPNTLKVKKDLTYGITHTLAGNEIPAGEMVLGTDAAMLEAGFITDFGLDIPKRTYADIFLEISLGGAHAPDSSGTAANVLAFGMTYGINGSSVYPWFFDGLTWNQGSSITTNKRWNLFRLQITANSVTLIGERKASGSQVFSRVYTGGFDTISVRTIDNDGLGQAMYHDDTWLTGGRVTPEPATLSLLGLGLLFLRRRRS